MRKLARAVAKTNMANRGIHKPCRKDIRVKDGSAMTSYFAQNWREYV